MQFFNKITEQRMSRDSGSNYKTLINDDDQNISNHDHCKDNNKISSSSNKNNKQQQQHVQRKIQPLRR